MMGRHLRSLLAVVLLGPNLAARTKQQSELLTGILMQQKADLLLSIIGEMGGTGPKTSESLYSRVGEFRSLFRGEPSESTVVSSLLNATGAALVEIGQKAIYNLALHGVGDPPPSSSAFNLSVWSLPAKSHKTRKRAVLVAWRYAGSHYELSRTINDIKMMYTMLLERGFYKPDITVLTDFEGQEEFFRGTNFTWATNIELKSKWTLTIKLTNAMTGLGPGDFLVFHYSGHGGQVPDIDGDELDEKDEMLFMPCDSALSCDYKDDEFYENILLNVPHGVQMTVLIDASDAEGFSDLPFNYMPGKVDEQLAVFEEDRSYCTDWVEARDLPRAVISFFSSFQYHQNSADGAVVNDNLQAPGAFMEHLISSWSTRILPYILIDEDRSTLFNRLKQVLLVFQEGVQFQMYLGNSNQARLMQRPTFVGWPMVRDNEPLEIWSNLPHDKAIGGPRHDSILLMRAPPRCSHGGRNVDLVKMLEEERPDFAASQNGSHILVDITLRDASAATQDDRMQGWQVIDRAPIRFDPNNRVGIWEEANSTKRRAFHAPTSTVAKINAARQLDVPREFLQKFRYLKKRFRGTTDKMVLEALFRTAGQLTRASRILRCCHKSCLTQNKLPKT